MLSPYGGPGPSAADIAARTGAGHVAMAQGSPMQSYEQPIGADIADYLGYGTKALQGANTLSSLMGNGSLYSAYPALGLFGPLAGLASGALRGGSTLPSTIAGSIASPGLYSTLGSVFGSGIFGGAITPAATGVATGVASAAPAVASGLATSLAGGITSLGAIAGSIDAMIHDNTAAKAMARNMARGKESTGIMSKFTSAIDSGDYGAEVLPGVRAGDLLRSLSGASARGELAGDEEGIFPSGRYQTLSDRLGQQGFRDIGWTGLNGLPGIKHANTLGALIGGIDETGQTTHQRQGLGYGQFQSYLDALTQGMPSAFGPQEALQRSSLFTPHNVGLNEAPPMERFRQKIIEGEGPNAGIGQGGRTASLNANTMPTDVLSRFVNDPMNWVSGTGTFYDPSTAFSGPGGGYAGTNLGMAYRAANELGLVDPNLRGNIVAQAKKPGHVMADWMYNVQPTTPAPMAPMGPQEPAPVQDWGSA